MIQKTALGVQKGNSKIEWTSLDQGKSHQVLPHHVCSCPVSYVDNQATAAVHCP